MWDKLDMGAAIRKLRGSRRQKDLFVLVGLRPGAWSLDERGKRRPQEATLRKIARALDCTVDELEGHALEMRRQRLGEMPGQTAGDAERPGGQGAANDPRSQQFRQHMEKAVYHLAEAVLVLAQGAAPQASETPAPGSPAPSRDGPS